LVLLAWLLVSAFKLNLFLSDVVTLSGIFSIVAFITLIIFFKGQGKEPDSQTLYSLVAVGLKFLLEIVLALIWFLFAKKNYLSSLLMFFVLYLTFSLFSLHWILKTLKDRS
jgi:hypothetical protein